MSTLTQSEEQTLVSLLQKLEPGFLPFDVFHQFARLYVSPIILIVPLRRNSIGKLEVLISRREPTDPIWPNEYALPGTVLRATDTMENFSDAFDRVLTEELKNPQIDKGPVFVGPRFYKVMRGTELILIHWIEILGETKVGEWHPIENLPKDLISTEIPTIQIAVKNFLTE